MMTTRSLKFALLFSLTPVGLAFAAPPENDQFSDRQVILQSSLPIRIPFDNTEATTEANEPGNPTFQNASVWYAITLAGGGSYQIDTYFSDKDFELEVYTGDAIDALTLEDSDDEDDCTNLACGSTVIVRPSIETTYQIRVVSPVFESGVQSGSGNLNITRFTPTAEHDDFANALPVSTGGSGRVSYLDDSGSITYEPGEPQPVFGAIGSLWFQFTPPVSAAYAFSSSAFLYEGDSLSSLSLLNVRPPRSGNVFELNGGQTYFLAIHTFTGNAPQSLIIEGPLEPAQAAGSTPIDLGSVDTYQANIALREGNETGEDFFWFENWHWTPSSNGTVSINVAGILSNPSEFSVHQGTSPTILNILAEIRSKGTIELEVTAGQTYTLAGIVRMDEEFVASGALSIELNFEPSGGSLPLAPADIDHVFNADGSLTLTWVPDPNTSAQTLYRVQYVDDLNNPWMTLDPVITGTQHALEKPDGTRGFYRIIAILP